ncbi:MAG: transposase [Chromatiaceae bacterium]|nr:transposase [Chromatiaceae bacterium]
MTFRYTDNTGTHKTRTLAGADFLWLLLRHVLPKGLRRSRDTAFSMPTASGSFGGCIWCCDSSRPSPSNGHRGAANTAAER